MTCPTGRVTMPAAAQAAGKVVRTLPAHLDTTGTVAPEAGRADHAVQLLPDRARAAATAVRRTPVRDAKCSSLACSSSIQGWCHPDDKVQQSYNWLIDAVSQCLSSPGGCCCTHDSTAESACWRQNR